MTLDRTHLITFVAGAIVGLLAGFFTAKGIYDRPVDESVSRDTVRITDTIPHYYPQPVDGTVVRYITRYLPTVRDGISQYQDGTAKRDTASRIDHFREVTQKVEHFADTSKMIAVEVPITSKHYGSKDYDAWVSGFEVSLDSIKVYKETQYITEVRTISKPPNKWELDLIGGLDCNTARQDFTPYAGGEILYKPNRLQVGVRAVVSKTANTGKFEPSVGGVVKIRIF